MVRVRYVVKTDRINSACEDIVEYDRLPTDEELDEDLRIHMSNSSEAWYEILEEYG